MLRKKISIFVLFTLVVAGMLLFVTHNSTSPLAPKLSIYQYLFKRDGASLDLELLLAANNHKNIKQIVANLSFDPKVVSNAQIIPLTKTDRSPFFKVTSPPAMRTNFLSTSPTQISYTITGDQAVHSIDMGKIGTLHITIKKNTVPTPFPNHSNYVDGYVHDRLMVRGTVTTTTTDGEVFTDNLVTNTFDVFITYPL